MKCQSCGKKEATVRYYENINGKQKEVFLCADCANNLGFSSFSDIFSPIFTSLPKFMYENQIEQTCPNCGYSFEEYTKTGLFGCPECYNTFKDKLDSLFLKINGKNRHVPLIRSKNIKAQKNNKNDKNISEFDKLKQELKKLVENEEYEKAAVIRDKIKKLEK